MFCMFLFVYKKKTKKKRQCAIGFDSVMLSAESRPSQPYQHEYLVLLHEHRFHKLRRCPLCLQSLYLSLVTVHPPQATQCTNL